jgi:WD40 repeat protein
MWKGGVDSDLYSLHFVAPSFDLKVYTTAVNPSRYVMSQMLWTALGASAQGGTVAFELHRLDGANQAYVSAKQTWTLANAVLRGTIYYWAIDQGQIVQLEVSTGARKLAFDSGPYDQLGTPVPANSGSPANPVWENNGGGKRCVACHAVSKDGSRLGAVFTRAGSAGPYGTVNLGTGAISMIGDYQSSMVFTTLSPDGTVAAVNYGDKSVHLLDTATGAPIASALDAMTDVCDPAFSPDGLKLAVSTTCDPGFGYPVEFRKADLTVFDYDPTSHAVTNPRLVLPSTGLNDAIAFSSFSPDSKYVFYQRGDYSRAKYGDTSMGKYLHGADDLYVSPAQASAASIPLDAANGKGVLPPDSLHLNYAPTVNPIAEGGYVWVVFTSPRDYGNRMMSPQQAAPNDATWQNRKQLWVTAVDATTGTTDPSHPAFWLPGQDLATTNMFGYWSLSPCKPTLGMSNMPNSCSAGFECCSGFCRDSGNGPVCVDAPSGCHQVGEKCTVAADCCGANSGVDCVAGICQGSQIL